MGWLKRLFGMEKPKNAQVNPPVQKQSTPASAPAKAQAPATTQTTTIPPERVGLNGEYDQSGLAKRVALAFDEDPELDDINTLYVAQTSGTVVLKGKVPNKAILDKMVRVAKGVSGATGVETNQVSIG
ncbi:MAG TPA: phospholipid-binding protein [Cyanobacteria bacterium UBA12227]|nr:phospholipid-binding protein [Cyanobacteria bacterium UBA12227]HBY76754.1 phospholipid-binding protein [Cyanobacteria bacterium UBA11148]